MSMGGGGPFVQLSYAVVCCNSGVLCSGHEIAPGTARHCLSLEMRPFYQLLELLAPSNSLFLGCGSSLLVNC
jgi:hypothetical protein